ncbi:MAG: hypothetical protein AB1422_18875 [bacterium]
MHIYVQVYFILVNGKRDDKASLRGREITGGRHLYSLKNPSWPPSAKGRKCEAPGFGLTPASEKLMEIDGIKVNDETLQRWLV